MNEYIPQEIHERKIKAIMKETNCTFTKWRGKEFWELANRCGHTSLDFNKCKCKEKPNEILQT